MEENEKKEIEENDSEATKGAEEKPSENGSNQPEGKGGRLDVIKGKAKIVKDKTKETAKLAKQKTSEFLSVKRNKIIVGACSAVAIIALVVGLSVGLTQCSGSGNGGDTSTSSKSDDKSNSSSSGSSSSSNSSSNSSSQDSDSSSSSSSSKGDDTTNKSTITSDAFASALKLDGDKFTVSIVENKDDGSSMKRIKDGTTIHLTQSNGSTSIQDAYYTMEGNGSEAKYYSYSKDSSGSWIKSEDASKNYDTYSSYDVNKEAFDDKLTYSELTFDKSKRCYVTTYKNDSSTNVTVELYFENGKIIKAIKSLSEGSSFTYTFSNTAVTITLPTDAHMHTFSAGTLDLNSSEPSFEVTCTSCNKTMTKDRLESDSIGTILYGYYPQSYVSDNTTINSLKSLTAESNGWYKLGEEYYAKATASVYGSIGSFDNGTQIVSTLDYWFKVEPIEWKVLTNSNGACSLVSNMLLDAHRFNADFQNKNTNGYYANNYAESEVRSWLNGDFLSKAFSLGSSYLKSVTVDNSASTISSSDGTYASSNTEDKVYLLSYADYANVSYFPSWNSKKCKLTDWARANYAYDPSISSINPSHYGQYWTRSPSSDSSRKASFVDQDGYHTSDAYVDQTYTSVRPAITVKLPVASDHSQHIDPMSGSLDLNNGGNTIQCKCPVCDATFVRDRVSTDKITGFLYGYYPQTYVSDETTINSLKNQTAENNDWYKLNGTYYAKLTANPCGINSTGKFDDGTSIVKDKEYWFRCDPIEWNVISSSNNTYSLVSTLLLDQHRFGDEYQYTGTYPNNYKESEIRSWLTNDFFNKAFPSNDAYIQSIEVDNSASTTDEEPNPHACDNTNDKIYLLSYKDFTSDSYFNDDNNLKTKTTDYARANGSFSSRVESDLNNGMYWTRSPLADTTYHTYVLDVGSDGYLSQDNVTAKTHSVRPGITITLPNSL